MRKPEVKNKYNLKPKDVSKLKVKDKNLITKEPFWRNDVVSAWCLSGGAGATLGKTEYWIGIYDDDAPSYKGKIRLVCSAHGGMCSYNFKEFFNYREIENVDDLKMQEMLVGRLNELIDKGVFELP